MFTAIGRLLKFALQDFVRNVWLSATTVIMLALTLVSAQVILLVHVASATAIASLERRVDLRIQFRGTVSEADADAVRSSLAQRPEVTNVEQHSSQQVLDEFLAKHHDDAEITDAVAEVGGNPFGPELRATLRRTEDFPAVVKLLEDPAVASRIATTDARDHAAVTAQLSALTGRLRVAGAIAGGLFLAITILIIMQAMRIVTYSRRDEAGIMRLVGAPNWFVRTPFLVFGVLAAACATALVQVGTFITLHFVSGPLQDLMGPSAMDISAFFWQHGFAIASIEFLTVALLTIIASAIAIRKYLRV